MSLKPGAIPAVPEHTATIARAAFPKGNLYLRLRDELGAIYTDEDFQDLYPERGQPGLPPWQLALVTVMQFLENLSDRQAADAVRARIDWKYALSLELTDSGFDFSVLSEFRKRLIDGKQEQVLLDKMLALFRERGLLKVRGRQRTDSTYVLAAVRVLNRLAMALTADNWLPAFGSISGCTGNCADSPESRTARRCPRKYANGRRTISLRVPIAFPPCRLRRSSGDVCRNGQNQDSHLPGADCAGQVAVLVTPVISAYPLRVRAYLPATSASCTPD